MSLYNRVGQGTYWRAVNLARCMVDFGHNVTLVAMSRTQKWKTHTRNENGLFIIESPDLLSGMLRSGWDIWDVVSRIKSIHHQEFDLVHAFECRPVAIYPALYLHKYKNIPLFTDWGDWFGRGGSVEQRQNLLVRSLLRPVESYYEMNFRTLAQGTTVINSILREKAINLGVPAETILLLRNGCDYKNINPVEKSAARKLLGIPDDVPVIGYIGSIFHQDAILMAESFQLILDEYPNALLLVAGYFNADIELLVGSHKSIIRTGQIAYNEIGSVLSVCDICWLPFRNSGANQGRWPLKLSDYMAAGCPIVSTNVGDLGEFIEKNYLGLISNDKPNDLCSQVIRLLEDRHLRREIGLNNRQLAETLFSWYEISKKLEVFYNTILENEI